MSQSQPQARASRAATPLPERPDPRSAAEVLRIVDQLCGETHAAVAPARLDSSLDRDLGLDSLARVELLARIERQFKIHLPDDSLSTVETPADLLQALRGAGARPGPAAQASAAAIVRQFASPPTRATTLIEVLEWHVAAQPDRAQVVFLAGDRESKTMSHADLLREAGLVAGGLAKEGLAPGAAVAIMLPSGLEFFHAFFGVLRQATPELTTNNLFVFETFRPDPMVLATGFTVATVALSLYLLPRLKGLVVAIQWSRRMHGFGGQAG